MKYAVVYIDAFTHLPFSGNPCAVIPHADGLNDEQMQKIARETNLSETSFIFPADQADFRVRYFTPRMELPFAGHPTIATAFLLAEEQRVTRNGEKAEIVLEFNIGKLPVEIYFMNNKPDHIVMTQKPAQFGMKFSPDDTAPCFSMDPSDILKGLEPQVVSTGVGFLVVPVKNLDILSTIKMDRERLTRLCDLAGVNAAYVFTMDGFDSASDTHARLFDPRGTMEDPFTGSAAGTMGAYIKKYKLSNKSSLQAEQGHIMGRPGLGILEIPDDPEKLPVRLGGEAVRVMEGVFII
jgi:trans-2,3-dihydro-3-hydroxyanthranilate isomerase